MAYSPKRGDYKGQSFTSQNAYRTHVARQRGFASYWEERKFHSGRNRDVGSGFWRAEKKEGTYNFYLKQWLDTIDHQPKPYERAQFDILFNAARKDEWSRTPAGPLALLLDYIGLRPLEKWRGIAPGDS